MAVIDADGLVLGRLCTHVAKRLLKGEEIIVINAEKTIISGNKAQLLEHYKHRHERGSKMHGPHPPRTPDRLLKRSVRGMLEYKKASGRAAYKRLKVYIGVPKDLGDQKPETIEGAKKPNLARSISLGELSKELGWRSVS